MDKIFYLIANNNWYGIAKQYEPKSLAKDLNFENGRLLAYNMLLNEERDDYLRDYATELLEGVRQAYPKEWSEDWKNDVFLGDAYYMTMKYNERYEAYIRAYEKAIPSPPSLLISIASCYLSPESPITLNEAENLVQRALKEEVSIEGVALIRGLYAEKKIQEKFEYWDKILKDVEKKQIHTQDSWPNIHPPTTSEDRPKNTGLFD
jgi:tetratricopeptide (TPR) repeat protein